MINESKEKKTIDYLNECINQYSGKCEWWQIVYSMEGWAEMFETTECNDELVRDYAPKLIQKLETIKEYVVGNGRVFESDIDNLIQTYGLKLNESKLHLNMK